jgi:hypothetical protein
MARNVNQPTTTNVTSVAGDLTNEESNYCHNIHTPYRGIICIILAQFNSFGSRGWQVEAGENMRVAAVSKLVTNVIQLKTQR